MTDEDAAYYDAAYLEARGPKKDGGLAAALATPEGRAEFKALFESLDANGDGALSSKEWGQGIGKKWHEDDAFKELMKKYFGGASRGLRLEPRGDRGRLLGDGEGGRRQPR